MDHSKHTPLRPDELNTATVKGANVYGPDDNDIGNVAHFHGTGQTENGSAKVCHGSGGIVLLRAG